MQIGQDTIINFRVVVGHNTKIESGVIVIFRQVLR
ncbi:hypothetical protein DTL36_15485 [Bremerella cremea]|nr:hypothetical protein DTL36_15485 [Bremerella cremea]